MCVVEANPSKATWCSFCGTTTPCLAVDLIRLEMPPLWCVTLRGLIRDTKVMMPGKPTSSQEVEQLNQNADKSQRPTFFVKLAQKRSVYWLVTQ